MAYVNNYITVTLSEKDKQVLIEAIKTCEQIANNCNYNCDMFLGADTVFTEIFDKYKNGKLPTVIDLYE